jgi:hypothetical protein
MTLSKCCLFLALAAISFAAAPSYASFDPAICHSAVEAFFAAQIANQDADVLVRNGFPVIPSKEVRQANENAANATMEAACPPSTCNQDGCGN